MEIWTPFSSMRTTLGPSLAENNMMGLGEKAELLKWLEPLEKTPKEHT